MAILLQFLFRLAFGMSLAMSTVPSRLVSAGYYRAHLYVVFGLHVLAVTLRVIDPSLTPLWIPLTGAILSFLGTIVWFAQWHRLGMLLLWATAAVSLWGAWEAGPAGRPSVAPAATVPEKAASATVPATTQAATTSAQHEKSTTTYVVPSWLARADAATGGWLLGTTMAAMLLGHWYLNSPGMQISPLRRLCLLIGLAVLLRAIVSGYGTYALWQAGVSISQIDWVFLALRWLSGIAGIVVVTWMSWKTLEIPNTQSATGILYVAVILAFIGELMAQLMGSQFGGVV